MMRSFDYARTLPPTPEGLPVFAVHLTIVVMAQVHIGGSDRRQWLLVAVS
jgi:hypothetical protein